MEQLALLSRGGLLGNPTHRVYPFAHEQMALGVLRARDMYGSRPFLQTCLRLVGVAIAIITIIIEKQLVPQSWLLPLLSYA